MKTEPYLLFDGRCEEALEFYRNALDAQLVFLMKYKESPEPHPPGTIPSGCEDKVMHACLRVGETRILASDDCQGHPRFDGFALSLWADDEAQAKRFFAALGDGGEVTVPLVKTFFSPCFGMLTDRFGVGWMVIAQA